MMQATVGQSITFERPLWKRGSDGFSVEGSERISGKLLKETKETVIIDVNGKKQRFRKKAMSHIKVEEKREEQKELFVQPPENVQDIPRKRTEIAYKNFTGIEPDTPKWRAFKALCAFRGETVKEVVSSLVEGHIKENMEEIIEAMDFVMQSKGKGKAA